MIKLKTLLNEEFSRKDFSKAFFLAYSSIFDIDMKDIGYFKSEYLLAPSYAHLYITLGIKIIYKAKPYCIYHKFLYYKFPKEEMVGLTSEEWMQMLKYADKFPPQNIDSESIRKPNKLFVFWTGVYQGEDFFHSDFIGEETKGLHSISDVVEKTKEIIDKSDSDNDTTDDIVPIIPNSKLVTV